MWLDSLKEMKAKSGLTTKEIAVKSGIPEPTLEKLFAGTTKDPKLTTMQQLVHFLGYTLDDLDELSVKTKTNAPPYSSEAEAVARSYDSLDDHGKRAVHAILDEEIARMEIEAEKQRRAEARRKAALEAQSKINVEAVEENDPESDNIIWLKFNNQKASAGSGFMLDYERMEPRKVLLNRQTRKADFCVEVYGRSMEPELHNGDILLIREQPTVDPGEIGLFIVDDCGYVKKMSEDGEELISVNPDYDNVPLKGCSYFRCCGKVLGVLDPEWIVER